MVDPEFQGSGQESDKEVRRCILDRLVPDGGIRCKIRDQLSAYRSFRGAYGCADEGWERFVVGGLWFRWA